MRLDRLDDRTREVVRVASVAGRHVSHELLAAVTGLGATDLEAALRSAVESNVLTQSGGTSYAFRHALLGEAVYDDLLPGERTRLHTAFSEALRSGAATGTAAELALHARRAGDRLTAVRAGIEAGNQAFAVGGPHEAAVQFLDALDLLGGPAGGPRRRRRARPRTPLRRGLRRLGPGRPGHQGPPGPPRVAPAGRPGRRPRPGAHLHRRRPAAHRHHRGPGGDRRRGGRAARRRPAAAARPGAERPRPDPRAGGTRSAPGPWPWRAWPSPSGTTSPALAVEIATTLTSLDETLDLDRLRATWLDTADRARAAGHVDAELRALYFLARLHHDLGDFDGALEAYGRVVSRGEEEGLTWAPFPAEARQMVASVLVAQGRLREAYDRLDVSGLNPPVVYEWLYYALQMQVQVLRGHTKQAAFEMLRAYWPTDGLTAINAATAELARAEQEGDAAWGVEVYDLVVETVRPIWHEWFQARLRLSTVVVGLLASRAVHQSAAEREAAALVVRRLLDDGERVIDFYAQFEISHGPEYHAWVGVPRGRGAALAVAEPARPAGGGRAGGGLARGRAGVRHLRPRARAGPGPGPAGGGAAGDGRRRRRPRGRRPGPGHGPADRPPAAGRGADRPRLHARPRAPGPPPSATLTPREAEILALVAEGRSNGEIGKQLFIATKTVSVHVSNILGKLDAASRTEAAAIARRTGLL